MHVLFINTKNNSSNDCSDINIESVNINNKFNYHIPEKYHDRILATFSEINLKFLHTVIVKTVNHELYIFSGKSELEDEFSLNLKIYDIHALKDEKKLRFKSLFQNLSENRIMLEDIETEIFIKQIPQEEFFEIIYEIDKYSLNHVKNNQYTTGRYKTLREDALSKLVIDLEKDLHPLAQKSKYAKRPLGILVPNSGRTEFQRDKERLVHAKAVRRSGYKAQVYNPSKGNHYRTRMTHTLEVIQIAKGISRILKLNEDLTEAIALGHDIGHTPYGHEGERQLDLIMSGKKRLSSMHIPENFGGFKHNYQSIRIANYLEEKYAFHEGLDITYQVLEGILKHTKIKKCKNSERKCRECINKCFNIKEFLILGDEKELRLEYDFCTSLEGQVVAWADEIAQRGHDIDDGIASGVLTIDELLNEITKRNGMGIIENFITDSLKEIDDSIENGRIFIDKTDAMRAIITPKILGYFIERLISNSRMNMRNYLINHPEFEKCPYITEEVITFKEEDKQLLDELDDIIKLKVINSQEVNGFDAKSGYIIKKLFKAYYANPRQLPDNTIKRINRELKELCINFVDIRKGKKSDVEREIKIYKGLESSGNDVEDFIKRKVYMRNIADFISGMTDEYANAQYRNLYNC